MRAGREFGAAPRAIRARHDTDATVPPEPGAVGVQNEGMDGAGGAERAGEPEDGVVGPRFGTSRLEAFSDGVMAVIITITALSLRAPSGSGLPALSHRLPALLVYILSFAFVGIYWNNHHHLLKATRRISGSVMWANLHLLFWLSLIPVITEWVGTDYRKEWPAATYGIVAFGAAIAFTVLVRTILRANGTDSYVARAIGSDTKGNVSLLIYAAGIGLAFVSPWISYALYASVAIMWFIPDRRMLDAR